MAEEGEGVRRQEGEMFSSTPAKLQTNGNKRSILFLHSASTTKMLQSMTQMSKGTETAQVLLSVRTRDGVLVAVALADAHQEGAIIVLGSEEQLLSFHTVYVAIVPPEQREAGLASVKGHRSSVQSLTTTELIRNSDFWSLMYFRSR